MATNAERRAWLAANGHPELAEGKGRLPNALIAEADAALAPADDYAEGTEPGDFDAPLDYVTADDPPEPAGFVGHEQEPPERTVTEERPSRPHATRTRFCLGFAKPKAKGARKARPKLRRVSIAPLIEDAYSDMAWAAAGIPPLRKLLQAQAPIAGVVLDPVVKDTIADPVLQIMARNHERMQVGLALLGTPAMLMGVLATAPEPVMGQVEAQDGTVVEVLMPGEATMQHKSAMLGLRYCVRAMATVSGGDALGRVAERAAANVARDDQVNRFIAWLLDIPAEQVPEETEAAEARDAGLKLAGVAQ